MDKVDRVRERLERRFRIKIEYVPEGTIKKGRIMVRKVRKSLIELEEGLHNDEALHVLAHEVGHHLHEVAGGNKEYEEEEKEINILAEELIYRYIPEYQGCLWSRDWLQEEYEKMGYKWPFRD